MILSDPVAVSPGYFQSPDSGDLSYLGESNLQAPQYTNDFMCTDCQDPNTGAASDSSWSWLGRLLDIGLTTYKGVTGQEGSTTINIGGQTQTKRCANGTVIPATSVCPEQQTKNQQAIWWAVIAFAVILLLFFAMRK